MSRTTCPWPRPEPRWTSMRESLWAGSLGLLLAWGMAETAAWIFIAH